MSKKMLYIPTAGNNPQSVQPLVEFVKDLEARKELLRRAYPKKLESLQDQVYRHQRDDDLLQRDLDKAITEQLKQDEETFKKVQVAQDQELRRLIDQNSKLEAEVLKHKEVSKDYTSIKSQYNQLDVALLPHNQSGSYLVSLNHKCLSVQDANNYGLVPCDKYDANQRFNLEQIDNYSAYYQQYNLNPNDQVTQSFPYNLVKSSLSGSCLESQEEGLYLKPCQDTITQRWTPSSQNKMGC